MLIPRTVALAVMFIPLAIAIAYTDVRYRRIPNRLVLATLIGGLIVNTVFGGWNGLLVSLGGSALAFGLMLMLHVFATMGAGDVKLFAAVGAIVGISHVLPTLMIVALTGGVLAVCKMIYARRVVTTMAGVLQFFYGLLPGHTVPRIDVPADPTFTLPYAVPICFGSVVSFFLFRA
ncbi:MAG TPA: A24 family peptidase [Pyrinomonadaceae bacterium]|nr:A24 family peptidase [Pyrinomonadaceae bacterium]